MGKQLGPGAAGDPDNPARHPEPEPAYQVQPTPTAPPYPPAPPPEEQQPARFPRHRGGGWYETSDGAVWRGEEEAEEAEAALNERWDSEEEL